MTIDEAIGMLRSEAIEHSYNMQGYSRQNKEQIAEWLEELKSMRNLDKTNFSDGYNKAIEDLTKANHIAFNLLFDDIYKNFGNRPSRNKVHKTLTRIAEQLKGEQNE